MSRHKTRFLPFDITEGLQITVGKAISGDPTRKPRVDNLLFYEEDLDFDHAQLVIKMLNHEKAGESSNSILDSVRIYLQDLDSKLGIVDLESENGDGYDKIIDLKDGDRFGLIKLYTPLYKGQRRGAKLKFRLTLHRSQTDPFKWIVIIKDVSYQSSPFAPKLREFFLSEPEKVSSESFSNYFREKTPTPKRTYDTMSETPPENVVSVKCEISDEKECEFNSGVLPENFYPSVNFELLSDTTSISDDSIVTTSNCNEGSISKTIELKQEKYCSEKCCEQLSHFLPVEKNGIVQPQHESYVPYSSLNIKKQNQGDITWFHYTEEPEKNKKRKIDYYSGSLGILIGAVGTLGVLSAIANFGEI